MVEFAMNYSLAAVELLQAGKIRLDRFKTPDWPDMIADARQYLPAYVHYALNAGSDDSKTVDWPLARRLLDETNTPYVNLHLAAREKDFPTQPNDRAVIERMIA